MLPQSSSAFFNFRQLDHFARSNSVVHRIDARAKILVGVVFIVCVTSLHKNEVSQLIPYFIFPLALAGCGGIPNGFIFRQVLSILPFALLIAIWNPILEHSSTFNIGPWSLNTGWLSFTSILLRFALTLSAVLVVISTTSFDGLCRGLQKLGVPKLLVSQLLLLHRYIFVLGEEAARLIQARNLRSFGQRGLGIQHYGCILGNLLWRTLDRAQRIHNAMLCRGFNGELPEGRSSHFTTKDLVFTLFWCISFAVFRTWNLPLELAQFTHGFMP